MALDPALYCVHNRLRENCFEEAAANAIALGEVYPQSDPAVPLEGTWPEAQQWFPTASYFTGLRGRR